MSEKKVVLVTGCSSGFGKAVCEELSKRGYDVVATARKKEQLSGIPARLKAELDVSSTESIQTAISQIVNELGHIDILINNAGFSVRSAIEEIDEGRLNGLSVEGGIGQNELLDGRRHFLIHLAHPPFRWRFRYSLPNHRLPIF